MTARAALLYQQRSANVRRQLVGQTVALYQNLKSWNDPDALAKPAARLSVQAQGVQAQLLQFDGFDA